RVLRQAHPLDDSDVVRQSRRLAEEMGLRRPPRIVVSPDVRSPLVVGAVRPVIVFPTAFAERLTPEEWRMALAHELAHIRHGDLWRAGVPLLAQVLFFFLPVRKAHGEWLLAREAACDAEALWTTGAAPAAYGQMLLKVAAGGAPRRLTA